MSSSFRSSQGIEVTQVRTGSAVRSGLLSTGLLSLVFGLLIIAAPALLAYIVASFFVVTGVSLLLTWWKLSR